MCSSDLSNNPLASPSSCEGVVSRMCLHVLEQVGMSAISVKQSVEFLQSTTLKQLTELIHDKKLLIKGTQEEYLKIKGRLDQVIKIVNIGSMYVLSSLNVDRIQK